MRYVLPMAPTLGASAAATASAMSRYDSRRHLSQSHARMLVLLLQLLATGATAAPAPAPAAAPAAGPLYRSTPADTQRCAHKGVVELIRTSPVIVKALAARVFTDAELDDGQGALGDTETALSAGILITLAPETIYKGASLLKIANGANGGEATLSLRAGGGMSSSGGGGGHRNGGSANGSGSGCGSGNGNAWSGTESAFQYEGQLNATLQPARCFDANMLKMLPAELIAFGKLLPAATAAAGPNSGRQLLLPRPPASDVLHISINGLHRWTPQFENHIWKHLGWDDWSDFTLCSVTCGKGVQQRFRRCLLDNPMVDMNMKMNQENQEEEEEDEEEDDDVDMEMVEQMDDTANEIASSKEANNDDILGSMKADTSNDDDDEAEDESKSLLLPQAMTSDEPLHKFAQMATAQPQAPAPIVRTNSSNEAAAVGKSVRFVQRDDGEARAGAPVGSRKTRASNQHKKRKPAKSVALSTLLCEGYNIEQRNCNSFECSDDISDLLKFYKKLPLMEELPTQASESVSVSASTFPEMQMQDLTTAALMGTPASSPTPSAPYNMGYIRSWRNILNFTLMITLRAKNDTKSTATIFSIRNATHNLYLEACGDGLRLYLERDNTTEMLPVKFNLYDYRWHQVAISIQNGDFISIYVDCAWTNSFVVSKRLYTLPIDADVEIGRGFNGELQQLLVLPEHQERLQCSNKRTSINEVKRYIIDTFIEDYGGN